MQGLLADSNNSAWSFGGSMITFVFPMILFIAVAAALYVLYTKPELIPGHRDSRAERSVSYTFMPGQPQAGGGQAATPGPDATTGETAPGAGE